ncbi:MAG: sirohydrochlorin cobaltochelatase [Oscillospiraceae bacterium]|nr:sirohydrochlorin cobaltochelatase [Oscillospiraceae bacterium]
MSKAIRSFAAAIVIATLILAVFAGCEKESGEDASTAVKPVILAVSFGTSYNDSRELTIGAIESALSTALPDYEVRRAFTSQIIIDKLKERDGIEIDNVTEAMDRLVADGVKDVVIQPTHVMQGFEYDDVLAEVGGYKDKFTSFKIGGSLLSADSDYDELVKILTDDTKEFDVPGTAIVYMGHGTEHDSNATYAKLQEKLSTAGYANYIIGTVEAEPSLEDVIEKLKEGGYTTVILTPLMIVAGDHANNDMAGDEDDSWKTILVGEGFDVTCRIQGLGQNQGVRDLIVKHVKATIAE